MVLKDISFVSPEENILYDEVLLELAEQGGREILRFWESSVLFIVLGKIGKAEDDLHIENIRKDKIPVLRRASGGGTVLQGQGCLNYSLILSKEIHPEIQALHKSYQFILGKMITALKAINVDAFFQPISDLTVKSKDGFKKISGNAQKRGKKFILHHGTVLYDFNFSLIERYLTIPKSVPPYRQRRSHEQFLTNIPVSRQDIVASVSKVFDIKEKESTIKENEKQLLMQLCNERDIVLNLVRKT